MKIKTNAWIRIGLALIAAALVLTLYNQYTAVTAGKRAEAAVEQLTAALPAVMAVSGQEEMTYPDYQLDPNREMPALQVDGEMYVGVLRIPALGLELPIQQDCDDAHMKVSPCRYAGSVYLDDMVICGHNYRTHFGTLNNLKTGDAVCFVDAEGNEFCYRVQELEVLDGDAVQEMVSDSGLTLFTCTLSGETRLTVRCVKD